MTAYYNEIDPGAAEWLRELIKAGEIAPGIVDERDIRDVTADELRDFTQCHWFAGIGGWSLALRLAGWPDDRPVWTGSCPCQPFSAAGKRGGTSDERHLWPHWFHLIAECRPATVFGEQVASKDGLGWLELVCADLEGAGYAIGAADLCAAGVGAPHIRQRLWFGAERMAHSVSERGRGRQSRCEDATHARITGETGRVEHASGDGRGERGAEPSGRGVASGRSFGGLADADGGQSGQAGGIQPGREHGLQPESRGPSGLADADRRERDGIAASERRQRDGTQTGRIEGDGQSERGGATSGPGPVNGFWRGADWLYCRDGKFRPVEPGTFPLAHGIPGRVGLLRGYGNAISPWAAKTFIEAFEEARCDEVTDAWPDLLSLMEAAE